MNKTDYIYLIKKNDPSAKYCTLNRMSLDKLKSIVKDKDIVIDLKDLEQRKKDRNSIHVNAHTEGGLVKRSYTLDLKREIMLETNVSSSSKSDLDDDQRACVNHAGNLYIEAGPGSGKTRTLIEIARKHKQSVLCLMPSDVILDHFVNRLDVVGLKPDNWELARPGRGIFAMTFSTYGRYYQSAKSFGNDKHLSEIWDCLIIDEAQDITFNQSKMLKLIKSKKVIYAGDPNQGEYIPECKKITLSNNYRTGSKIVTHLNSLSKTEQISKSGFEGNVIYSNEQALLDYEPGNTFIIFSNNTELSLDKDVLSLLTRCNKSKYRLEIFDGNERPDRDYIITTKQAKGRERKQVIIHSTEQPYLAASRAIERLVIMDTKYKIPHLSIRSEPIKLGTKLGETTLSETFACENYSANVVEYLYNNEGKYIECCEFSDEYEAALFNLITNKTCICKGKSISYIDKLYAKEHISATVYPCDGLQLQQQGDKYLLVNNGTLVSIMDNGFVNRCDLN